MSVTMNENAIALRFADGATAYQALSDLKHLSSATTEVRGAVLIERTEDGTVHFPEGMDTESGRGTAVGSLVGSLVGILGGPLGLMMGWGIGALIGGGHDYKRATEATEAVGAFTPHVPLGGTVILAGVEEADTEALDLLAARYGATLERRPADDVRAELKAMEKAADEIRKQEAKDKRDGKRAERERRAGERKSKDGVGAPGANLAPAATSATDAG
ncbi:histidine kinase [Streptomyces sp. NPDC088921]|uniref:histidine kinase n=1 Tax=unclassified Streptomyces TaxID=2593676 RepID=UPI00343D774E